MPLELHIDLSALRSNFNFVRSLVGPNRAILACVKANAYGHGLLPCARTLLDAGADALGVARASEAAALREAGVTARIVILGAECFEAMEELVRLDVEILVDSSERLDVACAAGRTVGKRPSVHLAVDTGMGRFGANAEEATLLAERLSQEKDVTWAGVMTHFPVADSDLEYTREQWKRFEGITGTWRERGLDVPCRHAANSAGIMFLPESHADMVRPGLMLYGMQPSPEKPNAGLKPVLSWKTEVAALHRHGAGETIGYGRTFRVERDMLIATLPAGYGDGVPWARANTGWVLVRGHRAPVVGRISMDQTTVDVTDVPDVALGDEVVLLGTQGTETITAEHWAEWSGTINYEVTTQLLPRVPRVYDSEVSPA